MPPLGHRLQVPSGAEAQPCAGDRGPGGPDGGADPQGSGGAGASGGHYSYQRHSAQSGFY